jgi:NADH-quinone oxidoreductase subunit A
MFDLFKILLATKMTKFFDYFSKYNNEYIYLVESSYYTEYYKIVIFFILALLICSLLIIIAYLFSLTTIRDSEKLSEYECGFEPFDNATRHPFDVHFYIVGILFLIFDVEIALIFPWVLGLQFTSWFGFYNMVIFLIIITVGFFYEWHRGALSWPQQIDNNHV